MEKDDESQREENSEPLSLKQIFSLPGAKAVILTFFCYCAFEQTAGQWAASYYFGHMKLKEEICAFLASLYYIGITAGRFVNGFLTTKFSDKTLVRVSIVVIFAGLVLMLIPAGVIFATVGMLVIGLGSAPIYPCIIHSTPAYFGERNSQAVIGVEMASAYVGICVMPPVFGFVADLIGIWVLPLFLVLIAIAMFIFHELVCRITEK